MSIGNSLIVFIVCEALVGLTTVVVNCTVILAIFHIKAHHTTTDVFMGNLALADLTVGSISIPLATLSYAGYPHDATGCLVVNCFWLLFKDISRFMILAIGLDRFIAVKYPFTYRRYETLDMAVRISIAIWCIGCISGSVPLFGWNIAPDEIQRCSFEIVISMEYMVYFKLFAIMFPLMIVLIAANVYIFTIVRKHMMQTKMLIAVIQANHQRRTSTCLHRAEKEMVASKLLVYHALVFFCCWFPLSVTHIIRLYCPQCRLPTEVSLAAVVISHANSAINPFLYALSSTRIRMAMRRIVRHSSEIIMYGDLRLSTFFNRGERLKVTATEAPTDDTQMTTWTFKGFTQRIQEDPLKKCLMFMGLSTSTVIAAPSRESKITSRISSVINLK